MSFNAGELEAYIGLNDDKFNRTLDRDRDELGRFVSKKHQTTLDIDTTAAQTKLGALSGLVMDHSEQIKNAGMKMTAGVTLPYAIGTALAVESASSLNEAQNKVNVVFDESAESVRRWGAGAADVIGQSERQALSAAGTFGNLFVSMDMGAKQSADMSMNLVNLASDLASFNDVDPAEALEALRSGLVGETEPMRRFGVNMNEATLKAQALAMGLQWQGETLPPLVKAQAAYALIMDQTATAQGDFARTADEVANAQRSVKAEAEDMAAAWGDELLPMMKDALGVAKPVLGFFEDLPDPVKKTAIALGGLFAVIGPSLWILGGAVNGVKSLSEVWSKVRTAYTVADGVAITANTTAVEANTIARTLNAKTPPVGSSGVAPGAVGTGAAGLGTAGAAASAGSRAVSIAGMGLAIGTATITTGSLVIEAGNAWQEWKDAELQAQQAAADRARNLGKLVGGWQREHPGEELPASIRKMVDEFKDEYGNRAETWMRLVDMSFNDAANVYRTGTAEQIREFKDMTRRGELATDKETSALADNTAAVEANTDAQKSLAQSILDEASAAASKGAGVMSNQDFLAYVSTMASGPAKNDRTGQVGMKYSKAARGADFVTNGPELLLVGDNASGRERVNVTPSEAGGGRASISFDFRNARFGPGITQADVESVLTDSVVPKLLDALAVI